MGFCPLKAGLLLVLKEYKGMMRMIKNRIKKFGCIFVGLVLLVLCSCTGEQAKAYKLSANEKSIVDTIYSCRNIWENHSGDACKNIRYVEKNGNKFLLASYGAKDSGVGVYASTEVKYTIRGNSMHEATLSEYGSNDYGLVSGMFSYSVNDSEHEKKLSIARAVTGKKDVTF